MLTTWVVSDFLSLVAQPGCGSIDFDPVDLLTQPSRNVIDCIYQADRGDCVSITGYARTVEEMNIGIGLLPESTARRNAENMKISIIPLSDTWSLRQLLICTRSKDCLPPYANELIGLLIEDGRPSLSQYCDLVA